jgi:hypothetical protein
MPVSYSQRYVLPALRRFFWAQEPTTAGTSIAASNAAWHLEPADIITTLMRERYDATSEPVGLPVNSIDEIELTHHTEIQISSPMRINGFHAYALASMMGDTAVCGTAETVDTVTAPNTHTFTPGIKGARQNTFSQVAYDTGAVDTAARGDHSLLMTYCTVQSVATEFHSESTADVQRPRSSAPSRPAPMRRHSPSQAVRATWRRRRRRHRRHARNPRPVLRRARSTSRPMRGRPTIRAPPSPATSPCRSRWTSSTHRARTCPVSDRLPERGRSAIVIEPRHSL